MLNKLMALWATIKAKSKQDLKDLWNQDRFFFIVFGSLVLIIKYRDILIDLLLNSSKRIFTNAQKQDSTLADQENQANSAADDLVKKAQEEPSKKTTVGADWNKK